MTATTTHLEPELTDSDDADDNLEHVYCCNENKALCGANITDAEPGDVYSTANPDTCLVCDDLARNPCEECGE